MPKANIALAVEKRGFMVYLPEWNYYDRNQRSEERSTFVRVGLLAEQRVTGSSAAECATFNCLLLNQIPNCEQTGRLPGAHGGKGSAVPVAAVRAYWKVGKPC
jgi:hypothetical protein